jgi:hypothetical protein
VYVCVCVCVCARARARACVHSRVAMQETAFDVAAGALKVKLEQRVAQRAAAGH